MDSKSPVSEWVTLAFEDAAKRIKSKGVKLLSSDYQRSGLYPIVDQGQALVVGYTDNRTALFHEAPPVVIFGDHTKTVKFVDFDFAVGADGVVLLKPKPGLDPKLFFYWMKSLELHDLGYSRHYKLLKDTEISFPKKPCDQDRIVSRIESLTTRAQELAGHTQAIASDMQRTVASFYERLAAEAPQQPLQQVASPVRRPITTTPDGSYPELGLRSFGKGTFHKPALSGTEVGNKRIFRIHSGDLGFSSSSELVKRQREITKLANSITEDLRRFEAALLAKAFRGEL